MLEIAVQLKGTDFSPYMTRRKCPWASQAAEKLTRHKFSIAL
jgi:hypothetical protein